jgi:hypothetical protein
VPELVGQINRSSAEIVKCADRYSANEEGSAGLPVRSGRQKTLSLSPMSTTRIPEVD